VKSTDAVAFLFALAALIGLARVAGTIATWWRQPVVVGEIVFGILIGPSFLHGRVGDVLIPTASRGALSALATVGVAVFMFLIGLRLDHALVRGQARSAFGVALGSLLVPFVLGVALAAVLAGRHRPATTSHLGFLLFFGAAMAITAFPVLARILQERGMLETPIGSFALAAGAVGDVLAWTLIAAVLALVSAGDSHPWRLALAVPYALALYLVVRPLMARALRRVAKSDALGMGELSLVLAGLLLSGAFTEWIGLHYIFGAFAFGFLLPRDGRTREAIARPLEAITLTVLLPVYFVAAGLRVDLSHVGSSGLRDLGLIMLVAVGGKALGAGGAAGLQGLGVRDSQRIAALLNTRGLTELVVLTIGLQHGILDVELYSLMVVMAVVTTGMTGPVLSLIEYSTRRERRRPALLGPDQLSHD